MSDPHGLLGTLLFDQCAATNRVAEAASAVGKASARMDASKLAEALRQIAYSDFSADIARAKARAALVAWDTTHAE